MFNLGKRSKLPPEALDQLHSILDGYDRARCTSAPNACADRQIQQLRDKLTGNENELWWGDIAEAELCIIDVLDEASLRARLVGWRRRLHEIAGNTRYAQYLTAACDLTAGNLSIAQLRADLSECVRAVYYFYSAYGVAAKSRSIVTISLLRVAAVILLIQAALELLLSANSNGSHWINLSPQTRAVVEWLIATSAAAVVGSIVSVQRRLQDPSVDVDPFYRYIQTDADWFGIAFISPLFGSFFGIIVYLLLLSNVINTSIISFTNASPHDPKDWAALLIFGFVAGFAEQLIPDALTRIAARALGGVNASDRQDAPAIPLPAGVAKPPQEVNTVTPNAAQAVASLHALQLPESPALQLTVASASLGQYPRLASLDDGWKQDTGVV